MIQCKTQSTTEVLDHLEEQFIEIIYWQPGGRFLTVEYTPEEGYFASIIKGAEFDDSPLQELTVIEFLKETI